MKFTGFKGRAPWGLLVAAIATSGFAAHRQWTAAPLPPEMCLETADRPSAPAAGMVWIAGGTFQMGSNDFRAEEAPARAVTVGGFWIDVHDVTNAQFARFVRETGYVSLAERGDGRGPPGSLVFVAPSEIRDLQDLTQWWKFMPGASWRHPEGSSSDIVRRRHHPVVHVAYEDALAYARWAGRALPTEAQWELAARAGRDGDTFTWGDAPDTDAEPRANHWRGVFPLFNSGSKGYFGTAPVGCFPANGYGLYDMAGNVWQWTVDPWADGGGQATGSKPSSAGTEFRVIKGGSFLCANNFCRRYRPAARQPGEAAGGAAHIGFRTVLAAPGAGTGPTLGR